MRIDYEYVTCKIVEDEIQVLSYDSKDNLIEEETMKIPVSWLNKFPSFPVMAKWIHKNTKIGNRKIVMLTIAAMR